MKEALAQPGVIRGGGCGVEEHRRWPRKDCAHQLVIHRVRAGVIGEATWARSVDFSTMGLGLLHAEAMAKGEQFLVSLWTPAGAEVPLLYSVVHCREVGDGQHQIGAELVSVFELDELTKPPSEGTVAECIARGVGGQSGG